MIQKLPVNGFKWVENSSKFNEKFRKSYNENSDRGYFIELDVECPKGLFSFQKNLSFLPERKKIRKGRKVCFFYRR